MKLFVWNINQRSSVKVIPPFVTEMVIKSDSDVIVLTEFINATNKESIKEFTEQNGLREKYDVYCNIERKDANGILIAIKKGFAKKIDKIEDMNTVRTRTEQPNFFQLDIKVNEIPISIIGTRIQIDCKKSNSKSQEVRREEYKERREQLLSLVDHINTLERENIIVAGDFNNSFIRKSYFGKDTDGTYNYQIMKDDFTNNGMTVFTPEGEHYSHGFKPDYEESCDGYLKEDHIVTKNLKINKLEYSHSFIKGYKDEAWKKKGNSYSINPPFPDHAILTADVVLLELH